MVTLDHLQYFINVAQCGSISKAAEKCFLERSNLSAIIARLEEHFGVRLFLRSSKGITLTQEGKQVLTWATQCLNTHTQLLSTFQYQQSQKFDMQHLTLYTSVAINENIYAKPINRLLMDYPTLSINIRQTVNDADFDALLESSDSVGLFTLDDELLSTLTTYPSLQFFKLIDVRLAAYATPDNEFIKNYSTISLKTLSQMPLLLYTINDQSPLLKFLRSYYSNSTIINTVSTPTMLQYLLATGKHISIGIAPPNTPPVFNSMKSVPIRDKTPLYFGIVIQSKSLDNPILQTLLNSYCELLHLPPLIINQTQS